MSRENVVSSPADQILWPCEAAGCYVHCQPWIYSRDTTAVFSYELQTRSAESGPDIVQSWPFTHEAHVSMSDAFSLTGNTSRESWKRRTQCVMFMPSYQYYVYLDISAMSRRVETNIQASRREYKAATLCDVINTATHSHYTYTANDSV